MTQETPIEKAKAAYPKATKQQKRIYEDLFGKEAFVKKPTLVMSFKEACKLTGDNPNTVKPYKIPAKWDESDEKMLEKVIINAIVELRIIAKALKGTHIANWKNSNELKWTPVFDGSKGFAYSHTACTRTHSGTMVGSRFAFPTSEIATHFGVQFNDLHKLVLSHN